MKRKIIKANLGTAIQGATMVGLKNMDKFSAIGNAAQMFSSFLPKQEETALQQGINNGAKQIGNVIGAVGGPIGQAVNAAI